MATLNTADEILAIIQLLQDLAPEAVSLVKALAEKLTGATEADIVALTHSINAVTLKEIDDELSGKKPS